MHRHRSGCPAPPAVDHGDGVHASGWVYRAVPADALPARMSLLDRVIHGLILDLVSREELELKPETNIEALAARVLERVRQAANHAHVGHEICEALVADPKVEELYASDSDIVERLNYFYA